MGEILGRNILDRLAELDMSQKELATKTGITESAVSHYIKGDRTPNGETLVKISEVLNMDFGSLLGKQNNDFDITKRLLARNSINMSQDQKNELIMILIGGK